MLGAAAGELIGLYCHVHSVHRLLTTTHTRAGVSAVTVEHTWLDINLLTHSPLYRGKKKNTFNTESCWKKAQLLQPGFNPEDQEHVMIHTELPYHL